MNYHPKAVCGPLSGREIDGGSIDEAADRRFWAKVDSPRQEGGCREWTSHRRNGYGLFSLHGETHKAHRVAWALRYGLLPAGMVILHECDNPSCVNPDHLRLGTQAENNADCEARGRAHHPSGDQHGSRTKPDRVPSGDRHGSRTRPDRRPRGDYNGARLYPERLARGSEIARARFTEPVVAALRAVYPIPGMTRATIAAQFGATTTALDKILSGRTWQHVPPADGKALDALCASNDDLARLLTPHRREAMVVGSVTVKGGAR